MKNIDCDGRCLNCDYYEHIRGCTADESVEAEWEEYQVPPMIVCSNCDWGTGVKEKKKLKKCPNCGAKIVERK